jgi:hypothetical protein
METVEGRELSHAILREGSDGQPPYELEVHYDGEGKCYFRDGWLKFSMDYGMQEGFFLVFTHCSGTFKFYLSTERDW